MSDNAHIPELPPGTHIIEAIEETLLYDEYKKFKYLTPSIRVQLLACYEYFRKDITPEHVIIKPEKKWQTPGAINFEWKVEHAPNGMSKKQFQSAVVTVLEDYISGRVVYHGFEVKYEAGYMNIYLSGCCPIHKRFHDGQAWKWVLKQKLNGSFAGFKCWRDESFKKIPSINQLL